jgi:hypothetical protein
MNLINSVTSGINFNFGNSFFNSNNPNINNINVNNTNYDNDADDNDFEDNEDENNENDNENEDNEDEIELFMRKREEFILELDEFQFKNLQKYSALKEDKCPICLQKYKGADIIKEFPCKHIFHKNCIFKWLKKSNLCPLCKYDITTDVNKIVLKTEEDE